MSSRSPSIVPLETNQDTYLVLDDFGERLGRAWRETDEEDTDRETLIRDLMGDQYNFQCASSPSIPPRAGLAT